MSGPIVRARAKAPKALNLGSLDPKLLSEGLASLSDFERQSEFRLGSNEELSNLRLQMILDLCASDIDDEVVRLLDLSEVYAYNPTENRMLFCGELPSAPAEANKFIGLISDWWFKRRTKSLTPWVFYGFVKSSGDIVWPQDIGGNIYSKRTNRSENARDYLERVYGEELVDGKLTLSDLRKRDQSLWRGLRNWAHAGGHDLDTVIPRGKTVPGPAVQEIPFDTATLNPNDPRDALILRGIKARENSRQTSAAYRRKRSITPS